MNRCVLLIITITFLASCSSPKYTYYFDHYDYNSGRKKTNADGSLHTSSNNVDENPLPLDKNELTASTSERIILPPTEEKPELVKTTVGSTALSSTKETFKRYTELSKTQRKEFRQAMRQNLKKYVIPKKSGNGINTLAETKVLDYDLKMAIIFGSVGLTLSLFGGVNSVFWVLSVISVVVGVVFLIKWLSRQ